MSVNIVYSSLRRTLAQRLSYWGGDIQNNGPGVLTANGTASTAIDSTRAEPDDEWNEAWIVLNPGSTDQAGSPTVWRRVAGDSGWVQTTGTLTIQGTWPVPYNAGPIAGTPYELYKVFRPESWLQAINWALSNAYPERHVAVSFELPQNRFSRIIKWGEFVKSLSIDNPLVAPVVTEVADGTGFFQPGTYSFAYSYYNDLGETLVSPALSMTFAGVNSRAKFSQFSGVPAAAIGVNYYSSIQAGDSSLGQLAVGSGVLTVPNTGILPGINENGIVPEITFFDPFIGTNNFPSVYNTTSANVMDLYHILQRVNPGSYPEIWNDLGSDLYKPLGGQSVMLMFFPGIDINLRFVCTASLPLMSSESDITYEPPEMLYSGAEAFLWNLLVKTSTISSSNWEALAKKSLLDYEILKRKYALDLPRTNIFRPLIRTMY